VWWDSRPNPLDSLGVAAAVRRSKFEFDLTNRVTGSSETLSSLSSSLKSPGVVPSSGNLRVPLVGVHGNGEPDVGDDRDIDASIPDARQSSVIRACAAWRAPSSFEIRAFSSAVMLIHVLTVR
jgi:hypothetical protein